MGFLLVISNSGQTYTKSSPRLMNFWENLQSSYVVPKSHTKLELMK
jgi:hypothetical protein